ncbi:hypothetical protein KP509_1Z166000 [Ceratopteris richardii]|nr:hypothetical protein KP509_1Z166000 [Ceratopteris richardii]KAH6556634.1 hypothetical protein KP509_1Z166000 [Ceratopteris richardii]KAH6556635.1 hypothetical protein KP509_1Z166000 [Ceratopteris richardii]KAH6556636.1 hypothetical protein KP509_1Z166000 [Ceratopteris richardii]
MLKIAQRRGGWFPARIHLFSSESRRIHETTGGTVARTSFFECLDGQPSFRRYSKPAHFISITQTSISYTVSHRSYSIAPSSRASTLVGDFRNFCSHALYGDAEIQNDKSSRVLGIEETVSPDSSYVEDVDDVIHSFCHNNGARLKQSDRLNNNSKNSSEDAGRHEKVGRDDFIGGKVKEASRSDEVECEHNGAAVIQDTFCKNEADLQLFNGMMDDLKASGKIGDAGSLEILEKLLAQVELSAVPSNKHRIGTASFNLAELYSSAKETTKSLIYAQKAFETLRDLKNWNAKYTACRCLYLIATNHCSNGEFEKALQQAEHLDLVLRRIEKTSSKRDFTLLKSALQALLIKCKISLGKHEEAVPHVFRYVKLKERLVNPDDPRLGSVYVQAAELLQETDHFDEAVDFAHKALDIHMESFGTNSYQVGYVRSLLSEAYYGLGLFEECLSEYDKAIPILETVEGNSKESLAPFIMKSVFSLIELKRYEESIVRLKEIIEVTPNSSSAHASALVTLAKVYALSNMKIQFYECSNKALDVLESNHKVSIPTGEFIFSLASAYGMQDYYNEAIMLYKKALSIFNQCFGDEAALKAADTEGEIGIAFLRMENLSESAHYLKSYISKNQTIIGSDNARLIAIYNRVGAEYLRSERMSEALEHLESAKVLFPKERSEIDDTIAVSLNQNLATLYKFFGRLDEAIACQKKAVEIAKYSNYEEVNSLLENMQNALRALLNQQD